MDTNITFIKKYIWILNISQLKFICKKLNIDYKIWIERDDKTLKLSNDSPHKEFLINKIFNVLIDKNTDKKIIYPLKIQNYNLTANLKSTNLVYFGQYKTNNNDVKKLMLKLTDGKFKFGAISQKIIKKYWYDGKTITYNKFAKLWLKEFNDCLGIIDYDELAYNKFMKMYGDKNKWKQLKKDVSNKFKQIGLL